MKNVKEIEIELKGKEWESILEETFKKKQKEVKVDGFRKGSVPKDVYLKKFGIESLYMDATDKALQEAYKKLLKDNKIEPIIEPKVDIKTITDKNVIFTFTIVSRPEIKLGSYKNLKVKKEIPKVTAEEINNEIETLRNKYAEIVVKDNGKVVDGNTAVIDFEGIVDGKPLEGGSGTDFPLELGSKTFIPGFEEGIVGMKIGETKTLDLQFPENYTPALKNKKVTFKITLKGIKERILPELNKAFYADLGYEKITDEKGLKEEIKKALKSKKEVELENVYIENLLEKASANMKVEVNEEIIDDEIHRMIHQYEEQLKMQGLSLEQYLEFTKSKIEDLKANMKPEALKRIKYRYLLEEIAIKEKVEITDAEAKKEAKKLAENYGMEEADFLSKFGGIDMVKYDLQMRKAIEILKNSQN
ncbi:MAG TPA: trigger factor [Bacilli bacterium]|nr:trigger factor [Bacilli bacterium]